MNRLVWRAAIASALVGLGWTAGHAFQATQADFILSVTAPMGTTTITCQQGCGLQFDRASPDKSKATRTFTYTCSGPDGPCGGTVQGWITR